MLISRTYTPKAGALLYHYCDPATFLAVCTNKTLRFSDVYSMNDFLEMHWGYHIWEEAASELLSEVGKEFLDQIDLVIHESGLRVSLTASCFSLDGDVLSQWRAYGNDGKGYVIGFKAKDLVQLPSRPLKVEYNKRKQIMEIKALIRALHEVEKEEGMTFGDDFFNATAMLAVDLCAYKNPAFNEEKEVRLVHLLNFIKGNDSLKLTDQGGVAFKKPFAGSSVSFRMRESLPVPYVDINFTDGGKVNPIKEVILGPKNDSRVSAVSVFLETMGIGKVDIKHSNASYR